MVIIDLVGSPDTDDSFVSPAHTIDMREVPEVKNNEEDKNLSLGLIDYTVN